MGTVFVLGRGERPQIACEVGCGVYETCGNVRTRVRKDKNWVEETCEKEDFQEKCFGVEIFTTLC